MPPLPQLSLIASEPLSIILLAHNDAPHVEKTVAGWLAFVEGLGRPAELIVADDGSGDGTADVLERLAAGHTALQVLRQPGPQGEGAALRLALAHARHPLVFYTLCDPHFQPADLQQLLTRRVPASSNTPEIDQVHLISACRAGVPVPLPLRLLGRVWRLLCRVLLSHAPPPLPGWLGWRAWGRRLLARVLFGLRYHDVACPFRLLRREALARMQLQSVGPFAHVELLAKANFLTLLLGEEMPLPAGHYPADRPRGPHSETRDQLVEARRLLRNPSFGPAVLPEQP
jgi:glycosyltransferase involved in cell wall biosynthesis